MEYILVRELIYPFLGDCVSTANNLKLSFRARRACMLWNLLEFCCLYLFGIISLNLVWSECMRDANSVVLSGRYTSSSDYTGTLDECCRKADGLDPADPIFDDHRLRSPLSLCLSVTRFPGREFARWRVSYVLHSCRYCVRHRHYNLTISQTTVKTWPESLHSIMRISKCASIVVGLNLPHQSWEFLPNMFWYMRVVKMDKHWAGRIRATDGFLLFLAQPDVANRH